ncbi:hypothetical protein H920_02434 [Fukomys damarensis]|uniref:Uncharacterized protein n=1 Tax=Fukomys damarensis TaxID=885580 RepID=A0A091DYU9_FUKDA|nr:hypothetical protein H920_02434 [Fukomys damarensis]
MSKAGGMSAEKGRVTEWNDWKYTKNVRASSQWQPAGLNLLICDSPRPEKQPSTESEEVPMVFRTTVNPITRSSVVIILTTGPVPPLSQAFGAS